MFASDWLKYGIRRQDIPYKRAIDILQVHLPSNLSKLFPFSFLAPFKKRCCIFINKEKLQVKSIFAVLFPSYCTSWQFSFKLTYLALFHFIPETWSNLPEVAEFQRASEGWATCPAEEEACITTWADQSQRRETFTVDITTRAKVDWGGCLNLIITVIPYPWRYAMECLPY